MSHTSRRVAALVGTVTLTSLAALVPATAQASATASGPQPLQRSAGILSIADAPHDVHATYHQRAVQPGPAARKIDLSGVSANVGLSAQSAQLRARIGTGQVSTSSTMRQRYTLDVSWGGTDRAAHTASVFHQPWSHKTWLIRDGHPRACAGLGAFDADHSVVLTVPLTCLGDTDRYRVRATSKLAGSGVLATDTTRWRTTEALNLGRLRAWRYTEKGGDVTYNGDPTDPATSSAESIDIRPGARVTATDGAVHVTVPVSDAATWSWEPRQTYTLTWRTGETSRGALTGVAERTSTGAGGPATFTLTGTGDLADCAATGTVDGDTVSIDVPADCTGSVAVAEFKVDTAATSEPDETGATFTYGTDTTGYTGRTLLR